jgi:hypothetical protein
VSIARGVIIPVAFEPHHRDHLDPIARLLPHVAKTRTTDIADIALVPSYGALIRARRMKFKRVVLAQHGAGQSYGGERRSGQQPGYPGGKDNADVGLFLVPNDQAAKRWLAAYPKTPVAVVGCPKLEDLPHRVGSSATPVVAVSFHWAAHFSPEAGSAYMHFWPQIVQLVRAGYQVIGHGHPLRSDLPAFYRRHGIEFVPRFEDVCRRADVYVCDNSSTIFEFASTDRPVVLLNSPTYRKTVRHGLRFWDAATVGVQVDDPKLMLAGVETALKDTRRQREERETALDLVYKYRSGAAQRAADAILNWAGPREAAA